MVLEGPTVWQHGSGLWGPHSAPVHFPRTPERPCRRAPRPMQADGPAVLLALRRERQVALLPCLAGWHVTRWACVTRPGG